MQVTVNMPDELAAQVIANGSTPESYVEELLAERILRPEAELTAAIIRPKRLSSEEFSAALDRLAQFSHKIPDLPDEAFTRASFYQDHD